MNSKFLGTVSLLFGGLMTAACAGGPALAAKPAPAITVVQCHSKNYAYGECNAPFRQPQLVRQVSSSPCVVNRSWGFNRATGRIWVAAGCGGVFAEASGFHYGQANVYDPGAVYYGDQGRYVGTYGPDDGEDPSITNVWVEHKTIRETKVAPPKDTSQDVDPTVQKFDKDGNPNYDYEGNYIGCHGNGCGVDNPDAPAEAGNNPAPENGTTTETDGNKTTTTTIETNKEGNAGRLEQTTTTSGSSSSDTDGDGDVDADDAKPADGN